jgi:hypothetical protein
MNRALKLGVLGAGYFAASIAMGADGERRAHADEDRAERVAVVNTPTVNVGTLPIVNVAGSVGIVGVPQVAVASLPGGTLSVSGNVSLAAGTTVGSAPTQTVGVSDSPASTPYAGSNMGGKTALVVKNADEGQRPFSEFCQIQLNGSQTSGSAVSQDTVPAGKRAVIEHASANCSVAYGQVMAIQIGGTTPAWGGPNYQFYHELAPHLVASNAQQGVTNVYAASQPLRAYIEPGSPLNCYAAVDLSVANVTGESTNCVVNVTGYLVDVP